MKLYVESRDAVVMILAKENSYSGDCELTEKHHYHKKMKLKSLNHSSKNTMSN